VTARWIAAAAVAVALSVAVFVPIALPPTEQEPDRSLRASIHDAFARRLQVGSDVVSTYGPWGILQRGDNDPRTRNTALAVSAVLAVAFGLALVLFAHDAGAAPGDAALVFVAVAALLSAAGNDGRFLAVEFLALLSALMWDGFSTRPPPEGRPLRGRGRVENPSHILLVALLAFVALIKLSYLVVAVFVLVAMTCIQRRFVYLAVFVAAFVAAWMAAGQHLRSLPAFFRTSAQVIAGYAGAQALPSGATLPLLCATLGAAALVVFAAFLERNFLRTAVVAGALFLTIKISYVRYDDSHAATAAALLPFIAIGYVLIRASRSRGIAAAGALAVAGIMIINGPMLFDTVVADFRARPRPPAAADDVPAVRGTIDAVPWGSAALIAHHLDYAPRPVFESHLAFTPALAELNAEYFRKKPPMWLWVSAESIDHYPPLLADGPAWLEIVSRYEPAEERRRPGGWPGGGVPPPNVGAETAPGQPAGTPAVHLLLRRRAVPLRIERQSVATLRGKRDEDVVLPDVGDALLWCSIDTTPTLAERVAGVLLRPARLAMRIDDQTFVVPAAMARGGFILDGLWFKRSRVRRIRLSSDFTLHLTAVRMPGPS
jgi:hypothetical protein